MGGGTPEPTYEFVDLGLPSGLKWANCNLGANSETEYGHYYMWGSVTPNDETDCKWETCPWGLDEPPMTTLEAEYDAAQVAGIGRMPTYEEFDELLEYTTNEWVEDYQSSGISGRLFTGSNGNSIFIPASGYRNGSDFDNQGYNAYVWSSSLFVDSPNSAWNLDADICDMEFRVRCDGCSVRPVSE